MIQDLEPPHLKVHYPKQADADGRYLLTGTVEPGASLLVNKKQFEADARGRFAVEIKLKKGINVVVVQAVDAAGNATFTSELVSGGF